MTDDPLTVPAQAGPRPEIVLRYAAHADGLVDLHVPPGDGPHPLVVLVHGGFWKQAYDRRHQRPLARALVASGCLVAAVEYRRVGPHRPVGWPAAGEDVAAAVRALPGLLDGLRLPVTTTTLVGHSAGGHLVLWLVARGVAADRVVALAPVADLRAAAADRLGDGAVQSLLGGEPTQVPERYAEADPLTLLAADPPRTPVVIVHGTGDDVVPVTQARALVAALGPDAPRVRLVELEDADHLALIDPASTAWPTVRDAVLGRTGPDGPDVPDVPDVPDGG